METKHIHIKDYNYALPDERIAKFPLAQRDHSKLLLYKHGEVSEDLFCNIANHLPEGALMVFNNTRVIQARMHFRKATGALIEVFLLEPYAPADYEQMFQTRGECEWLCMIGNLKKWKGEVLQRTFDVNSESVTLKAERLEDVGKSYRVRFTWDNAEVSLAELLDAVGELPIPPYLNRETQESDKTTYDLQGFPDWGLSTQLPTGYEEHAVDSLGKYAEYRWYVQTSEVGGNSGPRDAYRVCVCA